MNTFLNNMKTATNYTYTDNGAVAHKSTLNAVYDLYALGAAYRGRSEEDKILLFKNAFEEDRELALKCLFWIRDCRGGAGEREMFRVCYRWLAENHPGAAEKLLAEVANYGRWDDLVYATYKTPCWNAATAIIKAQLALDVESKTPSLLGKWMPSCNATSARTKEVANALRNTLKMSHRDYRKTLSALRAKINIVERLMSENRWEEIEFDTLPSVAGLRYKNAFARRDILARKYEDFAKSDKTVNAATLFPYEVVHQALREERYVEDYTTTTRLMTNKYWANLPDYFEGKPCSMLCMVDTSGSMTSAGRLSNVAPLDVAISLGIYCAERNKGPFKDYYMSFSSEPSLVKVEGVDFVDKVYRIYRDILVDNTNLVKAFDLLYDIAILPSTKAEDIPETLVVISDMQIDSMTGGWRSEYAHWTEKSAETEMERVRKKWAAAGLKMPRLIYWNVDAKNDTILDAGPAVTFVSGCSPTVFKAILSGKNGWDVCLDILMSERYAAIHL